MKTFSKWLNEYAGMTVGMFSNNKAYRQNGARSKWNSEGTEEGDKDPVDHKNADCKYLGINCKKKNK
jgi:hypothetical protein